MGTGTHGGLMLSRMKDNDSLDPFREANSKDPSILLIKLSAEGFHRHTVPRVSG